MAGVNNLMQTEQEEVAEPNLNEVLTELDREESKSPVQEVEEESFVKVELNEGLKQLNEALKRDEIKEIRSCYTNLTKTFPTAVINTKYFAFFQVFF